MLTGSAQMVVGAIGAARSKRAAWFGTQANQASLAPDIVVACPGRLLDHIRRYSIDLSQLEVLVIDEADRMLDMGFIPDIRQILKHLPKKRQTLLFSATQPREIRDLATRLLYEPVEVAVDPISSTVEPLSQSVYFVDGPRKLGLLLALEEGEAR